MTIKNRIRSREKRLQFKAALLEDLNDLTIESRFEEGLKKMTNLHFTTFFSPGYVLDEWGSYSRLALISLFFLKKFSL
jgi:hypothetical protein